MCKRYLTILEVSQKQAYIFSSNKLKDNIRNSQTIAWIMHPDYFEEVIKDPSVFCKEKNLVYSGGGHTVLEFETQEQAQTFTKIVTTQIHRAYDDIALFAETIPYREQDLQSRAMTPGDNLEQLIQALERKKSERKAAFHQGSFGIEKIDAATLKPVRVYRESETHVSEREKKFGRESLPGTYQAVSRFEQLGGDKGNSNFIAVVHIDGNAMGKRVKELYQKYQDLEWQDFKSKIKEFSDSVDRDFKEAYQDMTECVAQNLDNGRLEGLELSNRAFPVRKIILAGDDVCFVTEGRIGLECAAVFIRALTKKINQADQQGYAACAGVAIVHQKYPFYRAYQLAELLCSNAKRFGVSLNAQSGAKVSAIDWHIEYGEIGKSLAEIRKNYQSLDGKRLEMRPYIVEAPDQINDKEPVRQYQNFKKLITRLCSGEISYARGKIKEMRPVLKAGEEQARYFLQFNQIEKIILESYYNIFRDMEYSKIFKGQAVKRPIFIETADQQFHSYLFDAIEMMDTYLGMEEMA